MTAPFKPQSSATWDDHHRFWDNMGTYGSQWEVTKFFIIHTFG